MPLARRPDDQAVALVKDQAAEFFVADKGCDSDAFVNVIAMQGSRAVIPPRSIRLNPRALDKHIYISRNLIEHFFARVKQFRIITRCDKLGASFLSFDHLAAPS
jgi:transposase